MAKQKVKNLSMQKDSHRKHKKEKKSKKRQKQKQKKHHRQRSRSRSISSSASRRDISNTSPANKQMCIQNQIVRITPDQKSKQKKQYDHSTHHRNRINSNALINIISDQKKVNRKLDDQEIKRAADKFKQTFVQDIKPVTMSAFLSNQNLIKQIEAKQNKGKLHCQLCSIDFQCFFQLQKHIEKHTFNEN